MKQPKIQKRNSGQGQAYKSEEKPDYVRYAKPKAITDNHKKYHKLCKDVTKYIVLCSGWAGSGKSIVAAYYACQAYLNGETKGIAIMRSLEGVGNPAEQMYDRLINKYGGRIAGYYANSKGETTDKYE